MGSINTFLLPGMNLSNMEIHFREDKERNPEQECNLCAMQPPPKAIFVKFFNNQHLVFAGSNLS